MHLCSDAPKRTARARARPRGRVCRKNCVSRAAEEKSACTEPVVTTSQSVDREWRSGEKISPRYQARVEMASRYLTVTRRDRWPRCRPTDSRREEKFFRNEDPAARTLTKIEEHGEAARALKLETVRSSVIVTRMPMIPCNVRSER